MAQPIRITERGLNALISGLISEATGGRNGRMLNENRDRRLDGYLCEAIGQASIEIVDEALGDEWQGPNQRTIDKQMEHTAMEWLKGKLDDVRHAFATRFKGELSDESYLNMLAVIGRQARISNDPATKQELGRQRDALKQMYGRGYDRRNYGYYRNADEVRPDTPEEIQKNARNKVEMIKKEAAFALTYHKDMENEFAEYEKYANSANQQPNARVKIGGRRGFHGGTFYYYCTNSKGQPFFYPDIDATGHYGIFQYCTNDELYPYFPHNREEFERMKQQNTR